MLKGNITYQNGVLQKLLFFSIREAYEYAQLQADEQDTEVSNIILYGNVCNSRYKPHVLKSIDIWAYSV